MVKMTKSAREHWSSEQSDTAEMIGDQVPLIEQQ